jgi:hypothetical protein
VIYTVPKNAAIKLRRTRIMELHFSVTGERRKALVQSISEITGDPAVYASGAGRSYALGELMVDKDGVLDYSRHDGFIHPLVSELAERGFPCEPQDGVLLKAEEQSVPCIEMPLEASRRRRLPIWNGWSQARRGLSKRLSAQKHCRLSRLKAHSASLGSARKPLPTR